MPTETLVTDEAVTIDDHSAVVFRIPGEDDTWVPACVVISDNPPIIRLDPWLPIQLSPRMVEALRVALQQALDIAQDWQEQTGGQS